MPRSGAPLDPKTILALRKLGVMLGGDKAPPRPERAGHAGSPPKRAAEPAGAALRLRFTLEASSSSASPALLVWMRRYPPPPAPPDDWEPAKLGPKLAARLDDPNDRAIARTLLDIVATTASREAASSEVGASRVLVSRAAARELLPLVGRSGRLDVRIGSGAETRVVYRDTAWTFRLRVRASDDDGAWLVTGVVAGGGRELPIQDATWRMDGAFLLASGTLAPFDDGGAASWVELLALHGSMKIPEGRRGAFLEELYTLPSPPIDLPDGALPVIDGTCTPRLIVRAPTGGPMLRADLSFDYGGVIVGAGRRGSVAFDPTRRAIVRRDRASEARAIEKLASNGSAAEGFSILASRLAARVAELVGEGFYVEAEGRRQRRATGFSMRLRSGVDWFDLAGEVRFDGASAPLPQVLEALRRGERAVVLDDGSAGVLPDEWLAQHGMVLRLGSADAEAVRYGKSQLPLLAALTELDASIATDAGFDAARSALCHASSPSQGAVGAGFHGALRGYQAEGVAFLAATERASLGALLADEMGLGKTVQVLAHLASRPRTGLPSLVVAPRSLIFNWRREVARFAPDMKLLDHTGADRRAPGAHLADADLVLTTYGTLRRDADALAALAFDYLVLDEAQAVKNDTSDTARAARKLNARNRVALSGTPVENHLGELGSIVDFLNPGLLGRAAVWRAATSSVDASIGVDFLARAIRPFFLRRTKAEVAPELPARMEETWMCELGDEERGIYEALRARFRRELLGARETRSSAKVLEALLRLRQAACHPGLLDPAHRDRPSAKLKALMAELVSLRASGQKALVFSQFRSLLHLVKPSLEAEGMRFAEIVGSTRDREAEVARFQTDPAISVMLVSLKAGGVGLNLTAAEYVFLLDPWWNPAAEAQAIDRAHRIGQDKPVFAYRLIAKGTVEERIAELQEKKRLLADSVLRGEGAALRDLTSDDLDRLLS